MTEASTSSLPPESRGAAAGRGRLQHRSILVLGGGQQDRGIAGAPIGNGRAMAVLFAREGAQITVADRDLSAAEETARVIRLEGGLAEAVVCNVLEPQEVSDAFGRAVEAFGGVDGAVFNVGVGLGELGLERATVRDWDRVLAVNLRGAMLTAQSAMRVLPEGGSIVFISSAAAARPFSGMPSYDASKAGLAALMRHVAYEGRARRIRANIVAPGFMDTALGRLATRERPDRLTMEIPLGRQGTAWETAYAALFLISDEAAYVDGQVLAVDGGYTSL